MANRISDRMVKAFERFNADLKAFGEETGDIFVNLYEDAFTARRVANFRLYKNGNLKWIEIESMTKDDFLDKLWNSAIGYDWKIQRMFYDLNENAYYCIVTLNKRK